MHRSHLKEGPLVPPELQHMCVEWLKEDRAALLAASVVSHSWRIISLPHLFRSRTVTATKCTGPIPDHLPDPTVTFHDRYLRLLGCPPLLHNFVEILVLTGPSLEEREQAAVNGVDLMFPFLSSGGLRCFLDQTPHVGGFNSSCAANTHFYFRS